MALAIDTGCLARASAFHLKTLSEFTDRYHVYRVSAHATVIQEPSTSRRVCQVRGVDLATREALDWQADPDDDLDAAEVIHLLHQQAKSSPVLEEAISQTERSDAITTLVASCSIESQSRPTSAQGHSPLSSFHRCSIRQSRLYDGVGLSVAYSQSDIQKFFPHAPIGRILELLAPATPLSLPISGARTLRNGSCVVLHLQVDFVDLLTRRNLPISRPGKRRRTTLNPFHQVSSAPVQDVSPRDHLPEAKRFNGVRHRPKRKTWTAEMKPPKHKNKVWFGEFNCPAQAARAIDAAFHYYGKPHFLNFLDTPRILSSRPPLPRVLHEADKLRFVKEQVKWVASVASTLPASPPSAPPEIPESSRRGCIGDTSGFHSFSEIASFLSCGDPDDADDVISATLPSLHPDAQTELVSDGLIEPPFLGADDAAATMGTLEEQQGMFESISEDALVDSRLWSPSSSAQIAHGWNDADKSSAPAWMIFTSQSRTWSWGSEEFCTDEDNELSIASSV